MFVGFRMHRYSSPAQYAPESGPSPLHTPMVMREMDGSINGVLEVVLLEWAAELFPYIPRQLLCPLLRASQIIPVHTVWLPNAPIVNLDQLRLLNIPNCNGRATLFDSLAAVLRSIKQAYYAGNPLPVFSLEQMACEHSSNRIMMDAVLQTILDFEMFTENGYLHSSQVDKFPRPAEILTLWEKTVISNLNASTVASAQFLTADLPNGLRRGNQADPSSRGCATVSPSVSFVCDGHETASRRDFIVENFFFDNVYLIAPIVISRPYEKESYQWMRIEDACGLGCEFVAGLEHTETERPAVCIRPGGCYAFSVVIDSSVLRNSLPSAKSAVQNTNLSFLFYLTNPAAQKPFVVSRSILVSCRNTRTSLINGEDFASFADDSSRTIGHRPNVDASPFVSESIGALLSRPAAKIFASPSFTSLPSWYGLQRARLTEMERNSKAVECVRSSKHFTSQCRALDLESRTQEKEYETYNMYECSVEFSNAGRSDCALAAFSVPGLLESRPPLYISSSVAIRIKREPQFEFRGVVIEALVASGNVKVLLAVECMSLAFRGATNSRFNNVECCVRFEPDNTTFKVMRSLVHLASMNSHVSQLAMPSSADRQPRSPTTSGVWDAAMWHYSFLNSHQQSAVRSVLNNRHGSRAFCIWGPPGTGKSVTVIECVLQIFASSGRTRRAPHVLLCAPSNYAADLLVMKLSDMLLQYGDHPLALPSAKQTIFRLNDPRRTYASTPQSVIPFCCVNKDGIFEVPESRIGSLGRYKVIVTTCMSAALLLESYPVSTFSHVFVDEAAQALEAETYAAVCCSGRDTSIILSGDPLQLGPVVHDRHAINDFGLHRSLMERLLMHSPGSAYGEHLVGLHNSPQNEDVVVKLLHNYRSKQEILDFSSSIFYSGELIASSRSPELSVLDGFELGLPTSNGFDEDSWILPTSTNPCVFLHCEGTQKRASDHSVSWFNEQEANAVVDVVKQVCRTLHASHSPILLSEVTVIATFRSQVSLVRSKLRQCNLSAVNVGTVDDVQGQESLVVILTSVISRLPGKRVSSGGDAILDAVSNPNRLNVALSRAKALNVVIGNARILRRLSEHWKQVLDLFIAKEAYFGPLLTRTIGPPSVLQEDDRDSQLDDGEDIDGLIKSFNASWPAPIEKRDIGWQSFV
eukprot:ANDGO_06397.mRNA.1 putative RNA helicase SDE3